MTKRLDISLRIPIYEACLKASEKFSVSVPVFLFHAVEHLLGVTSSEHPFDNRNLHFIQKGRTKQNKRLRIREAIKKGDPYSPTPEQTAIERARELLRRHGKL